MVQLVGIALFANPQWPLQIMRSPLVHSISDGLLGFCAPHTLQRGRLWAPASGAHCPSAAPKSDRRYITLPRQYMPGKLLTAKPPSIDKFSPTWT